jgi:hypothetical protein
MTTPARATDVVFTRHPARRGLAWLTESWAMFSRARLPWLVLISMYYAILLALNLAGVKLFGENLATLAGQLLWPLLKPVLAVGLLAAAWAQERGETPGPGDLFKGFKANVRALVALGFVFVAGVALAALATSLADGGLLLGLVAGDTPPTVESLSDGRLQGGLLFGALVALPVTLALWFAPALVVFQDASPATALGASLRAALANWRPLLVYAFGVFAFGVVLPLFAGQTLLMLAPSEAMLAFVRFLLLAYGLMFAATLHISDYVSYRDVFHSGETLAPVAPGNPR